VRVKCERRQCADMQPVSLQRETRQEVRLYHEGATQDCVIKMSTDVHIHEMSLVLMYNTHLF
jgi:hypothetical protein